MDPVNDINLPYFAANKPAIKNVLSPISDININRNDCTKPPSVDDLSIAVSIICDAYAGCWNSIRALATDAITKPIGHIVLRNKFDSFVIIVTSLLISSDDDNNDDDDDDSEGDSDSDDDDDDGTDDDDNDKRDDVILLFK